MEILLGAALLGALAVGYSAREQNNNVWFFQLVVLLFGLMFCGLIVDKVADSFRDPVGVFQTIIARLFSIFEDGGEMIFGSLMAGHAFALLRAMQNQDEVRQAVGVTQ